MLTPKVSNTNRHNQSFRAYWSDSCKTTNANKSKFSRFKFLLEEKNLNGNAQRKGSKQLERENSMSSKIQSKASIKKNRQSLLAKKLKIPNLERAHLNKLKTKSLSKSKHSQEEDVYISPFKLGCHSSKLEK